MQTNVRRRPLHLDQSKVPRALLLFDSPQPLPNFGPAYSSRFCIEKYIFGIDSDISDIRGAEIIFSGSTTSFPGIYGASTSTLRRCHR